MLKNAAKSLLRRLGYRISRLDTPPAQRHAYRDLQYLLRRVERPVVFDVGAYRGEVASDFRRLFPDAKILAFEPNHEAFVFLQKKMSQDPNCENFCCGLADVSGKANLHVNSDAATSSLMQLENSQKSIEQWSWPGLAPARTVEIELRTIDEILAERALHRIDLLKMDVQGAEPRVLAGAKNAIRDGLVSVIYTEIIVRNTYSGQATVGQILETFAGYDFELFNVYNQMATVEGQLLQFDAIFCSRGFGIQP